MFVEPLCRLHLHPVHVVGGHSQHAEGLVCQGSQMLSLLLFNFQYIIDMIKKVNEIQYQYFLSPVLRSACGMWTCLIHAKPGTKVATCSTTHFSTTAKCLLTSSSNACVR